MITPRGIVPQSPAKMARDVVLGGVMGLALFAAWDFEYFRNQIGLNRERNRRELGRCNEELSLGMSPRDVRLVLGRPAFKHLNLYGGEAGATEWWLHTPLEFGAGNWTLGLQFTDGHLSATRVRIADGDFHPEGAAPDRGSWAPDARR